MIDFSMDGSWTRDGFFARFLGALLCFLLVLLLSRHMYFRQKTAMSSFPVSVVSDNRRELRALKESFISFPLISIGLATYGATASGGLWSAVITA